MARLPGNWENAQALSPVSYLCGFCGLNVSSERGWQSNQNPAFNRIRICPDCNRLSFFESGDNQVPGIAYGRPVPNVPAELDALYHEGRKSTAAGAHTAAVLACRKILMHIAVDHGAQPGLNFIEYVEYLVKNGFVPPKGKGWVDHIRKKGNEANHEIVVMGPDASKDLLTFIEMLLTFLYDFPARIQPP
ncbi:MAG: DUF4145 domain-containing protein [Candidatus Binatia bacterium]